MILKFNIVKQHLLLCVLALTLSGSFCSNASAQGFNVNLGSSTVDVSSRSGIASTSLLINLENPTDDDLDIAGYSFLFDVAPIGLVLPEGVSFDTTNGDSSAVTYISGGGNPPLIGAGRPGTINFSPSAGDVGLGQLQFSNGTVSAGAEFDLLMVNLLVDRSTAVLGDFSITLNQDGQNSINSFDAQGNPQDVEFSVNAGTLSIVSSAIPEPSSLVILGLLQTALMLRRRKS